MELRSTLKPRRPSDEVFAYIANFENNPQWQSGQIEARFTSEGPLQVGSTYDQVATFMGRRIVSTFEVLEYEPNRKVKVSSVACKGVNREDVGANTDKYGPFVYPFYGHMNERNYAMSHYNLLTAQSPFIALKQLRQ